MGNCCKRADVKPPSQVPQGSLAAPAISKVQDARGDEDILQMQAQHDDLRADKLRLEEELERWRQAQQLKINQMEEEITNIHEQTEALLKGEDEVELDEETRARLGSELRDECEEADKRELDLLMERQTLLQRELERIKTERRRLDEVQGGSTTQMTSLQSLLDRLRAEQRDIDGSDYSDETDSIEAEQKAERIRDYYGDIPEVKNFSEAMYQSRVDMADCSSQTIRNIKAMLHDIRTGDKSWYRNRPLRGVLCDMMQCGEEPHDKWDCELCAMMDVTDAPLLI